MSGKPGVVKKVIKMSRERDRTCDSFANYRKEIFMQFYSDKVYDVEYNI